MVGQEDDIQELRKDKMHEVPLLTKIHPTQDKGAIKDPKRVIGKNIFRLEREKSPEKRKRAKKIK